MVEALAQRALVTLQTNYAMLLYYYSQPIRYASLLLTARDVAVWAILVTIVFIALG
jgi:hypothetical protein